MDVSVLNIIVLLLQSISFLSSSHFQCLTCDNLLDGPGCGEFTREIPVRTCRTFCYFVLVYNRTVPQHRTYTRAIRDCSPYDDISIENTLLLQSKLHLAPAVEILSLRRCTSEQCNNDFYLQPDEYLFGKCSLPRSADFLLWLFPLVIIFYSQ